MPDISSSWLVASCIWLQSSSAEHARNTACLWQTRLQYTTLFYLHNTCRSHADCIIVSCCRLLNNVCILRGINIHDTNNCNASCQVWRAYEAARHKADQGYWWTATKRKAAKRWLVTLIIGVLTGLIAILVTKGTNALTDFKFNTVSCTLIINIQSVYFELVSCELMYMRICKDCATIEVICSLCFDNMQKLFIVYRFSTCQVYNQLRFKLTTISKAINV
jgi:hypothetical protein